MIKFLWEVLKSMGGWSPADPNEKPPLGMEATNLDLVKRTHDDNTWREDMNNRHRRDM
jgi:hypothetical protein